MFSTTLHCCGNRRSAGAAIAAGNVVLYLLCVAISANALGDEPALSREANSKLSPAEIAKLEDDDKVAKAYQAVVDKANRRLENDVVKGGRVVEFDQVELRQLLGKEPEFTGHPGQLFRLNSNYYEAYVWRSKQRHRFIPPPKKAEIVNMYALYSGEVRPDKVKYRTKGFDKNLSTPPSPEDARVLYVYYGPEDRQSKVRELLEISPTRVRYHDDERKPPNAAELKRMHESNLRRAIEETEKFGPQLTDEQKEKMDSWKYPAKEDDKTIESPKIEIKK